MSHIQTIEKHKIVAVIRKADEDNVIPIIQALYDGGVKVVEITAETPRITTLIEKSVEMFTGRVLIGAGTVLDPETARAVIMAGADFIVSPSLNTETIKLANRYGILTISGALTPTEILTAYENGAGMVKVFPADAFGPNYIKNVHGPLPHIPLMATGGVTLDNINEFISKGSKVVGIGSNLVNTSKLNTQEDYDKLTTEAGRYVARLNEKK
ncbi:bifunctional 4-hydroxy-2-oxoglutarate aldolase/2-dehydro-3-deoxy-phosphogluconate aldolase [Oceanobacillus saliphilus]|uniref:bifunctional 4-hydroxy-2-oxoglutarate aldolase/2-dehydro-3-deoxy-phosphogluconate aldolase n=1 Tax=Oceanobacillus saliphilus TaxID=2925834 RepID=UPI00201D573E|nr:bifunctional 4-hydroxy-2-oxoglutarate aldolase/2-dehydro-3-deoxy-phosphogluconate aldolase [Oceanobacillus saliphilus]